MGRSSSQLLHSHRADLLAPYASAGAAMTGQLTPQTSITLSSGGWKCDVKVSARLVSPEASLGSASSLCPHRSTPVSS